MTYGMPVAESIRRRQGTGETQSGYAARLGISQGELSKFLSGNRGLSRKIAAAVIRTYPDLERDVLRELFQRPDVSPGGGADRDLVAESAA